MGNILNTNLGQKYGIRCLLCFHLWFGYFFVVGLKSVIQQGQTLTFKDVTLLDLLNDMLPFKVVERIALIMSSFH